MSDLKNWSPPRYGFIAAKSYGECLLLVDAVEKVDFLAAVLFLGVLIRGRPLIPYCRSWCSSWCRSYAAHMPLMGADHENPYREMSDTHTGRGLRSAPCLCVVSKHSSSFIAQPNLNDLLFSGTTARAASRCGLAPRSKSRSSAATNSAFLMPLASGCLD